MKPKGLVIFADLRQLAPRILLPALLRATAVRNDVRVAGVFVTGGPAPGWLRYRMARIARHLQVILGSGRWEHSLDLDYVDPLAQARRSGVPVRVLPGGDPNDNTVVHAVQQEFGAALGISLYCTRLFREPLLACFEEMVNYHNGRLPGFRGTRASNWSIYLDEARSGYVFHRMAADIDSGAVLAEGEVTVDAGDSPAELEMKKAHAARHAIAGLLDAMLHRHPGRPQTGAARCFTRAEYAQITRVPHPESLISEEWSRRLAAFLRIDTRIGGRWLGVTGVETADGPGFLGFRTADGVWLRVKSVDFWPPLVFRIRRRLAQRPLEMG